MLTTPAFLSDTMLLFGIVGFVGLFLGLAFLRLFVPETHWLNSALHRIEGHVEFGGQSDGRGASERDCDSDDGSGD